MQQEILEIVKKIDTDLQSFKKETAERFIEMEQKFNTRFNEFDARFKAHEAKIDAKFKKQETKIGARFNEQEAKINTLFKEQETKIDTRFEQVDDSITKVYSLALQNRDDIDDIKKNMMTKADKDEIISRIDWLIGQYQKSDSEASLMKYRINNHEERLTKLEKQP